MIIMKKGRGGGRGKETEKGGKRGYIRKKGGVIRDEGGIGLGGRLKIYMG